MEKIFYITFELLPVAVSKALCHCGRSEAKIRNLLIIGIQLSRDGGLILNQVQDAWQIFKTTSLS